MHKSSGKDRRKERLRLPFFANYTEISMDEDVGKDFGILINAPISKDGHFVFKSEKDSAWSVDSSQYAQYFTLNLKILSAAINCIPFNEYMNIDKRYFTSDQLTSIYNTAEKGKAVYNAILDDLNASNLSTAEEHMKDKTNEDTRADQSKDLELTVNPESQSKDSTNNLEDIDFLLSLKEPVQNNPATVAQSISISHNIDSKEKPIKVLVSNSIDLEKWLDSILDD